MDNLIYSYYTHASLTILMFYGTHLNVVGTQTIL